MARYVVRRLLQMASLLFAISIVAFLLMHLAPGDPTAFFLDPIKAGVMSPEEVARLRARFGLDRPLAVQYARWLGDVLAGNWGYSILSKKPVIAEIAERLPNTILLGGAAFLLALVVAIPAGVISAARQYSVFDYAVTGLALAGISVPAFWLGLMLMQLFANELGWLPAVGMHDVRQDLHGLAAAGDVGRHLVLPAVVLAVGFMASWTRYLRSSILEVFAEDYIRTARAKGLRERLVIVRHALKNSLIPMITVLGVSLPTLLGGAFVIETVFGWPGMGRLGVGAILNRDYPVIMGVTMVSAVMVVLGNFLADVAYVWADPRIRL